jgi:hypothetical protein
MTTYMYVIDAYQVNAASALTFATVVRYLVSGGLTVTGIPFYIVEISFDNIGSMRNKFVGEKRAIRRRRVVEMASCVAQCQHIFHK